MGLLHVLVLSLGALLLGWLAPRRWLAPLALAGSILVIFWLQPSTPIRYLEFWLPVAALALTAVVWAVTLPQPQSTGQVLRLASGLLLASGVIVLIGLARYLAPLFSLMNLRPPAFGAVLAGLLVAGGVTALLWMIRRRFPASSRFISGIVLVVLLAIFIVLKTPALATTASRVLRISAAQSAELAGPLDLIWLGYSFLAFRLIHVLRDFQTGSSGGQGSNQLPELSFSQFAAYALFFPTYVAGPIDRVQHWSGDLEAGCSAGGGGLPPVSIRLADTLAGGERILIGVFKKFALADSLALFALSPENAAQTHSSGWMWVLLLGYTLRIYLDFSGYTDVAIGLGRLMGFHLPENFNAPYRKTNLTAFWNSWHITLALWFRAYVFNPLTRYLRSRPRRPSTAWVILIGQVCTMGLIGLWHGVTWNFLVWGVWHGAGLFVHNRWSDWARPRLAERTGPTARLLPLAGWALTFVFVSLGWVWFALPSLSQALHVFATLFGFS